MQNRNLLKKIALVAVIILLAGLPFIVREVRKNNANTNEPMVEQSMFDVAEFIEIHHERIDELLDSLRKENFKESFYRLDDEQQYHYPGFNSERRSEPRDIETMFSSRRFVKVFQEFQTLPHSKQQEYLSELSGYALNEFKSVINATHSRYEGATNEKPKGTVGNKYMVCCVMLMAAHIGDTSSVLDIEDKMNKIIQEEKSLMQKNADCYPNNFSPQSVLFFATPEDDCITTLLMYANSCSKSKNNITDRILVLLNKKTIPLVKWDSSFTYYDVPVHRGYVAILPVDIAQEFTVFSVKDSHKKQTIRDEIIHLLSNK
ncbi:hypothetical protein FACS1894189_7880 [Planctomycetales bacterium]|nr:hypothetical protein FACS1894189_7880 [Planctomycetales bacterium]